jgi:hypothetical protein
MRIRRSHAVGGERCRGGYRRSTDTIAWPRRRSAPTSSPRLGGLRATTYSEPCPSGSGSIHEETNVPFRYRRHPRRRLVDGGWSTFPSLAG